MRPLLASTLLSLSLTVSSQAATEFGIIQVRQINGDNESSSVSLSLGRGSSSAGLLTGGNRGDYNVSFGNTSDPASGVLIACAAQNSRDDSAVGGPATTSHFATAGVQISGARYYIPVFRSPEGDEANMNAAFAYLPYNTWLGGVASNTENGAALTSLTASPGLVLGTHFIDPTATEGEYQLKLSPLVANAAQNGVLLVSGAKNEDNHALSRARSDGSFSIYCHDNGVNGAAYENDPVAFCYLPVSAVGQNRLVALGRVNGNATTDVAGGSFTVTKGGTGQWFLSITGHSHATGTLVVSPEGGDSNNSDNIVSSEWDADNGRWVIESRDLPPATLQNMSDAAEDAFSFAFFSKETATGTPPVVSLVAPSTGTTVQAGTPVTLTASASDDGGIAAVRFYDGDTLIAEDSSAPYQFVWNDAPLGNHTLNARATDNLGFVTRSSTVTLAVRPPAGSGGLFFDGTDDHVNLGKSTAHQLTEFTLECWFRREPGGISTSTGGLQAIPLIAKGRSDGTGCDFFLGIDGDTGRLAADFKDATVGENHPLIGRTVIPEKTWHHAAATFDGSIWRLYLNGNLEAEGNTGDQAPSPDADRATSFGTAFNASGTPGGFFLGMLDEVRIWNRSRTQAEIRGGMNQEIATAADLVSRHGMDEASGTTIQSSAGGTVTGTMANGVFRTQGAPFNLNAPPTIEPTSPAHQQAGVASNAVLSVTAADPDDSPLSVRFFGRDTTSTQLSDFTVVALPDTQFYSENTGGNLAAIFSAQTDWIVAQRNTLKIAAVLHLGDISQNGDNPSTTVAQWNNASNAMYRLENPLTTMLPQGIPYSMAVGNHDQTPIGNADGTTTGFNKYFGVHPTTGLNHFRGKSYYGGTSIPESADNNYILFSAGGVDFIVISFEFDNTPDDDDIEWADNLLKAHPTRCGIITTHWTVNTGNPASFSPQGAKIYDSLKNNPNLILMHGGHIAGEGRRSDTYQGRTVHSLLADYQGRENGGNGWLRILTFRPSLNRIEVQTYSPTLNRYETDSDSRFSINVDLSGRGKPFVELGTVTAAPGLVSFPWNNRALATRYEWYAEVSDGRSTTETPVRSFTTAGTEFPPTVSFTAPANGASFAQGTSVTLQANAADADGTVEKVRYFSGTTLLGEATSAPFTLIWNNAPQGVHTLIAKATDNAGLESSAPPIEITITAPPTVTISVADGTAGEYGPDQSLAFLVARNGAPSGDLDVRYTLSGTASPVLDFTALPGVVRIPSGQPDALITATVLPDDLAEGTETLVLSLTADAGYQIGTPATAQAAITDKPFSEWLHAGGFGLPSHDDDGDGVPNILEYYMGGRADQAQSHPAVKPAVASDGRFIATFPRSKAAVDVHAEIQWSSDLKTWHASGESDGARTAAVATRVISAAGEDPELLEATLTITAGAPSGPIFIRLAVRP